MIKYEEQEIAYAKEIMAKALEPVEAWEKKIRESNEIFKKAGKAEKRVMIAKDVLVALKAKRIMPAVGSYYPSILTRLSGAGAPLPWFVERAFLKEPTRLPIGCRVCAKGAIFTAKLDRLNGVKVEDEFELNDPTPALLDLFSERQLYLIEVAYEGYDGMYLSMVQRRKRKYVTDTYTWKAGESQEVQQALKFAQVWSRENDTYWTKENRLKEIMKNIIRNKGKFVPSDIGIDIEEK